MTDHPSRRTVLGGAAATFSASLAVPRLAAASPAADRRLVVTVLRGGLDGIAAIAPVGDPAYEEVRDRFAMPAIGEHAGLPLGTDFALNATLPRVHAMYQRGEALFVHAVHTSYRARSHFEAQDILENGTTSNAHHTDGWLGRALASLPVDTVLSKRGAFAAASSVPLTLRGAPNVATYLPAGFEAASADTRARLLSLYEHTDPVLAEAMLDGLGLDAIIGGEMEMASAVEASTMGMAARGPHRQVVQAAAAAGRAMARDDGPRVGFLDMAGFDTHRAQHLVDGRLGWTLEVLDEALDTLRINLGPVWAQTVVLVVTEFGRTVRMNASDGTDHGSATAAMLLGGAVAGGRVVADWPGLTEAALFEGRDLMPTTDLRAVMKGVLADHFGLDGRVLSQSVFPNTTDIAPLRGLLL